MFKSTLIAGLLTSTLLTGAAAAQEAFDLAAMSDAEKAAFGAAVRAYLMENPETIMEAVAVLEQRQAADQAKAEVSMVADNAEAIFNDGFSYVGGNPDGDVTVVEFLDYRCGYCRKAHPDVAELIEKDGDIRLIVKEFPILGEESLTMSRFAVATLIVAGNEAYKGVSDALMTLNGTPALPTLERLAEGLGLDAAPIVAEMESDEVSRRLAETRALATTLRINGTPSFVFGEEMVRGYAPLAAMQEIVADVRAGG